MLIERPKSITTQVSDLLAERITSQEYSPGSRLPSESDLAAELRVSRASVRSALARLAAEGLVLRRQGDGTYVIAHVDHVPTRLGGLWNFIRLIENSGYAARIELLAQEVRPIAEQELQVLALAEPETALCLSRLFYADDMPVVLTHTTVPLHVLHVPPEECDGSLPLAEFVQRYHSAPINHTIFDIQAVHPDAATCGLLECDDAPLLKLDQVFFDRTNQPIVYSEAFFRDKVIRLRLAQAWD